MSLDVYLLENHCSHCKRGDQVWHKNISHNLNKMAAQVLIDNRVGHDLYHYMWYPDELGFTVVNDEFITGLERALIKLRSNPEKYKKFNPENGWGIYDGLVEFVKEYLIAAKNHKGCNIEVDR